MSTDRRRIPVYMLKPGDIFTLSRTIYFVISTRQGPEDICHLTLMSIPDGIVDTIMRTWHLVGAVK